MLIPRAGRETMVKMSRGGPYPRSPIPMGGVRMPAVIDAEKCKKCQDCVDVCPVECIHGEPDTVPTIDTDECTDCGACESECPESAITLE